MKTTKTIPTRKLVSIFMVLGIGFSLSFCSGTRPGDLGLRETGKLKDCPTSPNCVSSFSDPEDSEHFIQPISIPSNLDKPMEKLREVIDTEERTHIVTQEENYLHVEFTTKIMRYVDDVEFFLDNKNKVIQVRSASRLGKSDFGVNRKRIEKIRSRFNQDK